MIPMSWSEKATPPMLIGRVGNALSNDLISAPQIQPLRPFNSTSSPIVTITTVITGPCSNGPDHDPLDERRRTRTRTRA